MDYSDIYRKRMNRYGNDYKTRILTQRREVFARRLEKSVYRTEFEYNDEIYPCTFERYKQDNTEILHYLFTEVDVILPRGTILFFDSEVENPKDVETQQPWMVYWLEETTAKGYNRYIMLKMTHGINWKGRDGEQHFTYAYMYGQEDNMLKDEIRSRSRMDTIYSENMKLSFLVCPTNKYMNKDDYFEVIVDEIMQPFRVTGFDIISTPGIEFVTIDPIYEYDKSPKPQKQQQDNSEDFFWLDGD